MSNRLFLITISLFLAAVVMAQAYDDGPKQASLSTDADDSDVQVSSASADSLVREKRYFRRRGYYYNPRPVYYYRRPYYNYYATATRRPAYYSNGYNYANTNNYYATRPAYSNYYGGSTAHVPNNGWSGANSNVGYQVGGHHGGSSEGDDSFSGDGGAYSGGDVGGYSGGDGGSVGDGGGGGGGDGGAY